MIRAPWRHAGAIATVALLSACAGLQGPTTITDTAARTPQLSTLNRLIAEAGLADTLRGSGPFTVFAPSDEAFKALPAKTMAELAADKVQLKGVLAYHLVSGRVSAAEVKNGNAMTVNGANLALSKAGDTVTVEDAVVTQPDLVATNGVVHIIDRVLLPPKR